MKIFICIQKGSSYSDTCYPLKSRERRYLSKNQAPRKNDAIKSLCFILASGYVGHPNLGACSAFYFPLDLLGVVEAAVESFRLCIIFPNISPISLPYGLS